jgi:hypothetical protein
LSFNINCSVIFFMWWILKRATQVSIATILPASLIYTYGGYEPLSEIGVGTVKLQHQLLQDKGTFEDYISRLEAYQRRQPNKKIATKLPSDLEEYLMDIITKGKDATGTNPIEPETQAKVKGKKTPAKAGEEAEPAAAPTVDVAVAKPTAENQFQAVRDRVMETVGMKKSEPISPEIAAAQKVEATQKQAAALSAQKESALYTYARLANLTDCCLAIANYRDKEIIGDILQQATKYPPAEQLGALKVVEGIRRNRALDRGSLKELTDKRKTTLDVLKDYQTWWKQPGNNIADKLERNPLAKYPSGGWKEEKAEN